MTKLSGKQGRAIAGIIRSHVETARELAATRTLLEMAVRQGICPLDWEIALAELKKTPEYLAGSDQFEAMLSRIEQDADENDLIDLLEKMSSFGSLPN